MARLPAYEKYKHCPIPKEDPLRFHYWPIVGRLYHRRIDNCLSLLPRGDRVLDVGYGSGTSFLGLGEKFREVHGLDTHEYDREISEVFEKEGLHVNLRRGSILAPPYPDEYFDAVLAVSVLEHLHPEDEVRVMAEMSRMLKPSGVLVVGVPGLNTMMSLGFGALGCNINEHHFSSPEVVMHAASQFFKIDRVIRNPSFVPNSLVTYVSFRGIK